MSTATDGRMVEWAVRDNLAENGYFISRGAGSKGDLGDIVAVKQGEVLFVNVKKKRPPGPTERADLLRVAACLPGVALPIVALGPASRPTYRRLTGHGPAEWVPWTPDQIGESA